MAPSPEVWTRVEAELRKRRRRRFLWWWLPGIVAGIGLSWFLAGSGTDTGEIKEDTIMMSEPAGRSTGVETQTDDPKAKRSPDDDRPAEPIMAERKLRTSNHITQDDHPASITVTYNRRSKPGGKQTSTSTPIMGKDRGAAPDRRPVEDRPAARQGQAPSEKMMESDPALIPGSKPTGQDSTSRTSDITKLSGSAAEQDSVKRQANPAAWVRSIGLGGGMSRIGGNINGISGIGLSYGLDMQWYRPIGKSRFGFSAGIGIQGFTTKAGGGRTPDLFSMPANLTTGTFDPQSAATGMQWLHRIDLPLKAHFSPNTDKPGRPVISAGIIPGYIVLGPPLMTASGNAPLRRWQWAVSLEASAVLSKRTDPRTRTFLRWQAGMTDLWMGTSAVGSRASFLEWGIRRTLR